MVIHEKGVVQPSGIIKANVHDISYQKSIDYLPAQKQLVGDRACISTTVQADLFDHYEVKLKVQFGANQHNNRRSPGILKSIRQTVETLFTQLCDPLNLCRNYTKRFSRLATPLASKLSKVSILQWE